MFDVWLHPTAPLNRERLWHHVEVTLLEPVPDPDTAPVTADDSLTLARRVADMLFCVLCSGLSVDHLVVESFRG